MRQGVRRSDVLFERDLHNRRMLLLVANLLRFFGLFGCGARSGQIVRLRVDAELRPAIFVALFLGILAALAHIAVVLVQGLRVYSARRQQGGIPGSDPQFVDCISTFRIVAWGELGVYRVGSATCAIPFGGGGSDEVAGQDGYYRQVGDIRVRDTS